jgi:succinate dehydrogenase hydrophobic anchor subunit
MMAKNIERSARFIYPFLLFISFIFLQQDFSGLFMVLIIGSLIGMLFARSGQYSSYLGGLIGFVSAAFLLVILYAFVVGFVWMQK